MKFQGIARPVIRNKALIFAFDPQFSLAVAHIKISLLVLSEIKMGSAIDGIPFT
jgi:hypothetical protein